jgi:hypothetical protein
LESRQNPGIARYITTISSTLAPEAAFAYMADFANAREWDPSVSRSQRVDDSTFDLTARFGGRDVELRYRVVERDPPRRVVLEAKGSGFTSRDTITVSAAGQGSEVHYDALLAFEGARRLLDPVMSRLFKRLGDEAAAGLRRVLNS